MKPSSPSSEDTFSDFTHQGPVCHVKHSQEQVAKMLGISRQAVHKIERKIIYKLRLALLEELSDENPELCLKIIARWKLKNENHKPK